MAGGTFPTTVPSYTITAGVDTANAAGGGTGLSGLLNNFETDVTALATKVGTGATAPAGNQLLFGTGAGTSAWQGLTSAQLAAVISDETGSGLLVFGTSPTIVTPTIASLTNAQHNHSNAAGGGQLTGSTALVNSTVTADKLATGAAAALVTTTETTASVTYAFLTTTTDQVTVTIGVNGVALVSIAAGLFNSGANDTFVGVDISGATTVAAADTMSIRQPTAAAMGLGAAFIVTGLTAGSNTFKLKYRVSAGTGSFFNRRIGVVPL